MRLSKIRLAGFKSFVDPTSIQFPSNLMGIVGPNGCGKSNIIDAVRWVMGESSAKHLRGDSMADVIFNGSAARKPVGNASIELVFDNSDGTVGGQFANYSEISVKRVVSRDGTSLYYLNNTRCRRKDITSVFLGTGLGPRSYAIIEQGMISRLIEARPEELRVYLEEAAGISKYKDRRRETENRIRHTKENLSRLNDLREEVEKQIRHLQRQARTAERYKEMKQAERRLEAELLALRLGALESREASESRAVRERETALQAAIARLRESEASIEEAREAHAGQTEALNEVQGRFYRVGAEIARLEQAIQHARELRQRQEKDLEQVRQTLSDLEFHIERDETQLRELDQSLGELRPGLETARAAEESSARLLAAAEEDMQAWQARWEEFNRESGDLSRIVEVERARIEELETQSHRLVTRRDRCVGEQSRLEKQIGQDDLAGLEQTERKSAEEASGKQAELDRVQAAIASTRQQEQAVSERLHQSRGGLQTARGELASLEALQEAALGRRDEAVREWLQSSGLDQAPRLAERLEVEDGWERAVETVLGNYLEAVCVDGLRDAAATLSGLTQGTVSLLATRGEKSDAEAGARRPYMLASRVQGPDVVTTLLEGVRTADSLGQALEEQRQLEPGQSVVTRDGIWMGIDWLRVNRPTDGESGVIRREREIRSLRERIEDLQAESEHGERALAAARERLASLEEERDRLQGEVNAGHRRHGEVRAQLTSARERRDQVARQLEQLKAEAAEIGTHLAETGESLRAARGRLEQSIQQMADSEGKRSRLEAERGDLRQSLERAREQAAADRAHAHEIAIKVESRKSSRESAEVALRRLRGQVERYRERQAELGAQLAESEDPSGGSQAELNELLRRRVEIERELSAARDTVQAAENRLRELQEERQLREREADEIRQGLDELKLTAREVSVRRQTVAEQFAQTEFELEALRAELPGEAAIEDWESRLEDSRARIARLGPINLASIDELKEQSERKEYLDSQFDDLTQALTTLENAIRKIDRETRTRFKETFDRVNDGLKAIFPRLFGGGHAYLELTGEDLLEAGVTVMARPPGKRISTIHLLSGGEKALTAVALVFSIFELNPAPFCMLDEVDAPLDDANVGRFCDIVREKSERVQFIIITHNKTTMEMAHQLAGVTMQEPGVSRLVAVDLDEAVQMAAM